MSVTVHNFFTETHSKAATEKKTRGINKDTFAFALRCFALSMRNSSSDDEDDDRDGERSRFDLDLEDFECFFDFLVCAPKPEALVKEQTP